MSETSSSLIGRIRDTADAESWREFVALYEPLLLNYVRSRGLGEHDAHDLERFVRRPRILLADLIRDGKPLRVGLPVTRADDRLIRPYRGDYPAFFVHGPLVFSPVIDEAISFYMRGNPAAIAGSPLMTRDADRAAFPGEELVVVTAPMLAHKVVKGYSDPFGQVVADVDGVKVRNLHHLVELLRDGRGEFLTLRFCGKLAETMVFRRKAIEEATSEVMAENGIPKRGTDDVMAVWNARPTTSR